MRVRNPSNPPLTTAISYRECIQATTWPSPDPNEKPIYIPAGAKSVMIYLCQFRLLLISLQGSVLGDVDASSPRPLGT
jgi:hypothetical protein